MKILYALQGTGNGHTVRALEIIPYLKQRAEVDILISGYQSEIELPWKIKYKYHGLSFVFGKNGGINIWKSLKQLKFKQLIREIKTIPVKDYDLIINDFEPITAWASKIKNTPIISLSHQNAVTNKNAPKYGFLKPERLILKYYAPAKIKFGFHFKTYNSSIFTPILRKEIRYRNKKNKGHYTVYLPAYNDKKIIKILSHFKNIEWQIFSKHTDTNYFKNNITIQPVSEKGFINSLTTCEGVLCGAGFETPAEALFLRKKLMVIPMKNQYEQQCNALALKEIGVPVIKKLSKKNLLKIAKWIKSDKKVTVNYPDVTEDILDTILLPYINNSLISQTTIV